MKINIIIFLFLCFNVVNGYAEDSQKLLKTFFKNTSIVDLKNGMQFRFCPDNTCDLISFNKKIRKKELWDIGFLYLYFSSNYSVLDTFRKSNEVTSHAQKLYAKYNIKCSNKVELSDCVSLQLQKKFSVIYSFERIDEGKLSEEH